MSGNGDSVDHQGHLDYLRALDLYTANKISSSNCFDLKLLENLNEIRLEQNFQNASFAIEAAAQIYTHRVDQVHSDTLRVSSALCGNYEEGRDKKVKVKEEADDVKNEEDTKKNIRGSTLESWDKITLTQIEADDDSDLKDPVFAKTARLFDAGGMKGLLLNNLEVDSNFRLQYTSTDHIHVESVAEPYPFTDEVPLSNKRVLPQADVFKQKLWDIEPPTSALVETSVVRKSLVSVQAPKSPTSAASCATTAVLVEDDEEGKKKDQKGNRLVGSEYDDMLFDRQVTFEELAARVTLKSDISYFDGDWTSKKIRFNWKSELDDVAEDEPEDGEVDEASNAQCDKDDCKDGAAADCKDGDPALSFQIVVDPEKLSMLDENEPLENHRLDPVEIQRQMSINCPPHLTDLITLPDTTVQCGFLQSALRPAFFLEFTKDDAIIAEKKDLHEEMNGPTLFRADNFDCDEDSPTDEDFDADGNIHAADICPFYGSNDMFLISPSRFVEQGGDSVINDTAEDKQPEDEPWLQSKPVVDVAKVKTKLYDALVNEGADTFQGMMGSCKDEKMKDTSVAVCFVCTMHLANEQKLDLRQGQNKEDFGIAFNDKKNGTARELTYAPSTRTHELASTSSSIPSKDASLGGTCERNSDTRDHDLHKHDGRSAATRGVVRARYDGESGVENQSIIDNEQQTVSSHHRGRRKRGRRHGDLLVELRSSDG